MKEKKIFLLVCIFFVLVKSIYSIPLYSPDWGFYLDLPENYYYAEGNGYDRFSFENTEGAIFDLLIYHDDDDRENYSSPESLVQDILLRLNNRGMAATFIYRQNEVWIIELNFRITAEDNNYITMTGWALVMELDNNQYEKTVFLAALAYGPNSIHNLHLFHLSALDSITPDRAASLAPGPITEFTFPRENPYRSGIYDLDIEAIIFGEDAEAAQYLIEREFQVLIYFQDSPYWQEAWMRYYRAIYRDSYERLNNIAAQLNNRFNNGDDRAYAEFILRWVQSFEFERNFQTSDFVNLVSAAIEGRGDCDSRAMLFALVLNHANIEANMMVSREYSHAMGLVNLAGEGARFEMQGVSFIVAETTANIPIGRIGADVSNPVYWLGIPLH